ncbi:MAG TPA: trigger factor [Acidobacteriaceae bacterium]|nr:trigger factor [Acidobacteriaceae bacterium]
MSATETIEETPQPESQAHEGHEHNEHDHEHQHGPALNPDLTREVGVEVPAEEVARAFKTVVKRYQKQARIPGFRSGKVPESLIRSRFAEGIRQDVVESMLPGHFRTAMEQQNLHPISQPQVTDLKFEEGQPLTFKAVFEVMPEFSTEGYDQVKVEKPDTTLTDEEFQAELDRVRDSRSTMEPVTEDRPLADGDWAQISFKGEVQGEEASPEGEAAAQPISGEDVMVEIGGQRTLAAFNEALRGAKPGQELKFEATYPEEFGEQRLSGKTVSYDVEVKSIKKRIQPELNDEFAKELGDYESMEDFKTKLREHLAADKERHVRGETQNKLTDALVAHYQFPVPESLVQNQIDARLERGLRALAAQGMRPEDMRKLDFARLREGQRESAVAEVKATLILDKIADAEKVEVSDEELENELQMISLQTREPLESLQARLTNEGALTRIREQLRREKTASLLYERLV